MTGDKIRYLVAKPGPAGSLRHYWQPSAELRRAEFAPRRLSDDAGTARREAMEINDGVDGWRRASKDASRARPAATSPRGPAPARWDAAGLARAYRASRFFKELRPSTQRGYDWALRLMVEYFGERKLAQIAALDIEGFYKFLRGTARAPTIAKANAIMRVLRVALEFARRQGAIAALPAMPRLDAPRPLPRGASGREHLWTAEAVAAFAAAAARLGCSSIGLAVEINYWLGQRQADILALPAEAFNRRYMLHQAKTGAKVEIDLASIPGLLRQRVDERLNLPQTKQKWLLAREDGRGGLAANAAGGEPWTAAAFRRVFAEVRADAASAAGAVLRPDFARYLSRLQFLHLRHTAVTRLAEAGCSLPEIAAVTGHGLARTAAIIDRYLARTPGLAAAAMARRFAHEGTQA